MTDRDHSVIEELLSIDALGGLEDADRALLERERAAHGDCEECAALEVELSEVAGRLGLSLDPVPVRAGMADDILRSSGSDVSPQTPGVQPGRLIKVPAGPAPDRERRDRSVWRGLAAVAAAFVLFVGGWVTRDATSGDAEARPELVRFSGDAGTLAMAYEPGRPGVVLFGSDLPDPGEGRVYAIWMIEGDSTPVRGGCVRPQDGRILAYVDAEISTTDTMAVTVEPDSCPAAPTTDPVLTASLA